MSQSLTDLRDAVKQSGDIVDLLRNHYQIELYSNGSNRLSCRCPIAGHDDRHPSCSVDSDKQSFRCWSCGANGDIIALVMGIESLDFVSAVKKLSLLLGISEDMEISDKVNLLVKRVVNDVALNVKYQTAGQLPGNMNQVDLDLAIANTAYQAYHKGTPIEAIDHILMSYDDAAGNSSDNLMDYVIDLRNEIDGN